MKGIVFNLLQEVVCEQHGEDTWDVLLESAKLDGSFTSLGSYPDGDLMKLVGAAASALGQSPEGVLRWFGHEALPRLAVRYPQFFEPHANTRAFLLTLNDVIHPEVRKIYPGADVPEFAFDSSSPDVLVMDYRSRRRLCALAEGFAEAAAEHYGEHAVIEQPKCMNRGDEHCRLRIALKPIAAKIK